MRACPMAIVAVIAVAGASIPAQTPVGIATASWLAGCWRMERPDGFTEEYWLPPAGGAMLGMNRTIRNGRMTEYEHVLIREMDGRLAFIAKPSGQAEATFPMVESSATELVFEDLSHDFPQRVIYRKVPEGIAARVEATKNGKTSGLDFAYKACRASR